MNRRTHALCLLAQSLGLLLALGSACFAQRQNLGVGNPTIKGFQPIPTLGYAAIDMSGSTTSQAVTMVALDDNNNAAFALPTESGTTLSVYTWTNGSASLNQTVQLSCSKAYGDPSIESGTVALTYSPAYLLPTGQVDGWQTGFWYLGPTYGLGAEVDDGSFSAISGTSNEIPQLPPPFRVDEAESGFKGLSITAVSSNCYAGGINDSDYDGNPSDYATFICQSGNYTVFESGTSNTSSGNVTVKNNITFNPTGVNNNGWAIGKSGSNTGLVWTSGTGQPQPLPPSSSGTTTGKAINDAGNVIEVNVDQSGTTGYLWTSGSGAQPILQLIHGDQYQSMVSNIVPTAISGTDAKGNFCILFDAQYQTNGNGIKAPGTFLLAVQSGTNPNLQQLLLPPNVGGCNIDTGVVNAEGIIAAIGNIATTDSNGVPTTTTGTNHALLLLPVSENTVVYNSIDAAGWNDGARRLYNSAFQTTAVMPPIGALPITVTIEQDYAGSITVGYADKSRTSLTTPGYQADVVFPGTTPAIVSGTNAQGDPDCTLNDQPSMPLSLNARNVVATIVRSTFAKDFVMVQIGNNNPELTAETSWQFFGWVSFGPNEKPIPGGFVSSPATGGTNYGAPWTPLAPAQPRNFGASANNFMSTSTNWVPSGVSGTNSDAIIYIYPPGPP